MKDKYSFTTAKTIKSIVIYLLMFFSVVPMLTALKAGILEKMLFRDFIMRLLESRWNKLTAIAFSFTPCGIL